MPVVVLTNSLWPGAWIEDRLEAAGVRHLLAGVVVSSELEHCKPHPAAFLAAADTMPAADPADLVVVGDRRFEDVAGGHAAGMRTILVGPGEPHPPATCATPTVEIPSLRDLPSALGCQVPDRATSSPSRRGALE